MKTNSEIKERKPGTKKSIPAVNETTETGTQLEIKTGNQKREEMKNISLTIREMKENGSIQTINEGLKEIYKAQGNEDLRTFEQWQKAGFQVKKGAKALYLWGRQTAKKIIEDGQEKEITYFPLVPVFSENQVYNSFNNK